MQVRIPDDADSDEAAAIVAVVRRLAAQAEAEAAADGADRPRDRWGFTGRIEALQNRRVRAPSDAPADAWSAAGRTDRF
ncbi:acc operon protein [Natronomonas sp. F2-12]|jgi:uncharacterized membrane-anchored protein|uniref:Acc operon protein n=1 Tax=Natronomonas aquatica TaxID=2841590 RepID=A0A9R1CPL0_9EURY|nr:acc operon protein [Natronomonas aquatica]MCQ4332719.1 acc operon protein [Natronomonas aquatica]